MDPKRHGDAAWLAEKASESRQKKEAAFFGRLLVVAIYPQLGLSNVLTTPLALTLACITSWKVSVDPSEPVPRIDIVDVSLPFFRLLLSPNHAVKRPVNEGWVGSFGVNVKVPV
ncbi:MAG: hypothetical protein E6I96_03005, partial [Chloroflexi bacterium]